MSRFFLAILFLILSLLIIVPKTFAQGIQNQFERGRVIKIVEEGKKNIADIVQPYQIVEVKLLTGADRNKTFKIEHGSQNTIKENQLVRLGDEVVLVQLGSGKLHGYFIQDKYRLPSLLLIFLGFFTLVIAFTRLRGLFSILGMIVSLLVLVLFIVPSIARGADPVIITLIGSALIIFVSIFLAHGFNTRTTIAVGSTLITLLFAVGLSQVFVSLASLSGAGSEDAYALQFGQFSNVNLRGLLLSGIIIGTLGVLDDITTSLSAAVGEISKANEKLNAKELYKRGLSVGREHITSLVNTLVLAYAGASMPLFLFFLSVKDNQPLWVVLNSELIVEEVVRALVGSTALILAVPITTFAAAMYFGKRQK